MLMKNENFKRMSVNALYLTKPVLPRQKEMVHGVS